MTSNSRLAEVIHMADHVPSPQLDDGYTKVANELLDAIIRFGFSSRQFSVVFALIRKTYGYNKTSDDIGLSQLEKITGIYKTHLSKTVRELAEMRVINRSEGKFGHKLSINKRYTQWGVTETVTGGVTELVTDITETVTVTETVTGGVTELVITPVTKTVTTKDNHTKEKQPKEKDLLRNRDCATNSFDEFWAIWKNKKDKKKAVQAFAKINPDADLLKTILAAVHAQNASAEWIEEGGKYIPHPTTWLNGARWDDEVKPAEGAFTAEQQAFVDSFNENIGDVCLPVRDWSQKCADLISLALSGKWDIAGWVRYWLYVRDKCRFKGQVSFEWLVSRDNLVRVKRGEFEVEP